MTESIRRVVTGHDAHGKSIVLSDGSPPQHHSMLGPSVGADFFEIWNVARAVPMLTAVAERAPDSYLAYYWLASALRRQGGEGYAPHHRRLRKVDDG